MKHTSAWKTILAFTVALLIYACTFAAAENAPASQFGIHGWPYRKNPPCATQTPCPGYGKPDSPTTAPQNTPASPNTPAPQNTPAPPNTPAPTSVPSTAKPTATPTGSESHYTMIPLSAQEQTAFNLLNADRRANGLSALPLDAELSRLARRKCEDMRDQGYFSHTSPTLGTAADMLTSAGYAFSGVGENIAHHATVEKSEAAFMSSIGHRRNILGSQWTRVGVGVCYDQNGYVYVTQLFAR